MEPSKFREWLVSEIEYTEVALNATYEPDKYYLRRETELQTLKDVLSKLDS